MTRMSGVKIRHGALSAALGLFVFFPTAAFADTYGCASSPLAPEPRTGASVRAYVDPQTGELTERPAPGAGATQPAPPTATQRQQAASPEPLVEVIRPDGSVSVDIGDRFMMELRAEVVNGRVVYCHRPVDSRIPASTLHKHDHEHVQGPAQNTRAPHAADGAR